MNRDNPKKKNSKGKLITLVILSIILVSFIGIAASSAKQRSSSPSKAAVYTKISDFGSYSDWAQQQLGQGYSMCSIQNKLAETDHDVSVVPNCDTGKTVDCTTMDVGIATRTQCKNQ